ncbi:MAG TPA: hypothetical protein ENK53_08185 [Thiotrichales bacterium]|nr:hypothetical protein [Thiotrichales bacterium]
MRRSSLLLPMLLLAPGCSGPEAPVHTLPEAQDCDAARDVCEVSGEGLRVRLHLGPGVKPMRPFPVRVEVADAEQVVIRFEMPGMDMGRNLYRLKPAGAGRWEGRAVLPVCLSGRSDWVAEAEILTRRGRYVARFPFRLQP